MQTAYRNSEAGIKDYVQTVVAKLEDIARESDSIIVESAKGKEFVYSESKEHTTQLATYLVHAIAEGDVQLFEKVEDRLSEFLEIGNITLDKLESTQHLAKVVCRLLKPYIEFLKPFSKYTYLGLSREINSEKRYCALINEDLASLRRGRERVGQYKETVCCEFAYLWNELENGKLPTGENPLKVLREEMIWEACGGFKKGGYEANPVKQAGKKWYDLLTPEIVRPISKRREVGDKAFCCWRSLARVVVEKSFYDRKEKSNSEAIQKFESLLEEKESKIREMENVLEILKSFSLQTDFLFKE